MSRNVLGGMSRNASLLLGFALRAISKTAAKDYYKEYSVDRLSDVPRKPIVCDGHFENLSGSHLQSRSVR